MNFACKILASFLLIFILSTKGVAPTIIEVQGVLNHDVNLNIIGFQMNGNIDDIRWTKNETRIAWFKGGTVRGPDKGTYQLLKNGTLKIGDLQRNHSDIYKVVIYDMNGQHVLTETFDLRILEKVSKPVIYWSCTNKTMTCEVTKGTDPELKLIPNVSTAKPGLKVIMYKWTTKPLTPLKCMATNKVSKETSKVDIRCSEKGLDNYLISGICGGGVIFLIFVALLILFLSNRKKQHRRKNDEEVEIRAHRITSDKRSQKPHQIPASAPQNPVVSQPPPAPSHRPQALGHRPPPPGHRVQHQHQLQKRPPHPPGTQAHQQKGPPLPRPRVQPKPPRGATENL